MERVTIDAEYHEGAWQERVWKFKVSDIGEFASRHIDVLRAATVVVRSQEVGKGPIARRVDNQRLLVARTVS